MTRFSRAGVRSEQGAGAALQSRGFGLAPRLTQQAGITSQRGGQNGVLRSVELLQQRQAFPVQGFGAVEAPVARVVSGQAAGMRGCFLRLRPQGFAPDIERAGIEAFCLAGETLGEAYGGEAIQKNRRFAALGSEGLFLDGQGTAE